MHNSYLSQKQMTKSFKTRSHTRYYTVLSGKIKLGYNTKY